VFIRIESSSGVPITRQIADQIRNHSASGGLAPGDKLPSVRQLARDLAVNPNTILHVYERLTSEGLLERRQGDGTYVSHNLPAGQAKAQREMFVREVDRLGHRAADLGIPAVEVHKLLDESFARVARERAVLPSAKSGKDEP
jgi:GntR family transcriptional regulator